MRDIIKKPEFIIKYDMDFGEIKSQDQKERVFKSASMSQEYWDEQFLINEELDEKRESKQQNKITKKMIDSYVKSYIQSQIENANGSLKNYKLNLLDF